MANSDVLNGILSKYGAALKANPQLRSLAVKASKGSLTVAEAQRGAGLAGKLLGELMADGLGEIAGDGALAITDALAVVPPSLRRNHKFVSSLIQGLEKDGELETVVPAFNADRARNLAKYTSEYDAFNDHKKDFQELVENNSRSIVDESQEQTAQARYEMGFTPTISRSTVGETCDWCNGLAGTREYNPQTMNRDIFARHRNCDCLIELNRNGSRETVNNYSRRNTDVSQSETSRRNRVSNDSAIAAKQTIRNPENWKKSGRPDIDAWNRNQLTEEQKQAIMNRDYSQADFSAETRERHFEKHRNESNEWHTIEDYLQDARSLLQKEITADYPAILTSDNAVERYDYLKNQFVVGREDGSIRTFFKPQSGVEYWRKEYERN